MKPFAGDTAIFIYPGYRFKAVDALLTNFHLPKSTLFMPTCAFAGTQRLRAAYAHAVAHGYRILFIRRCHAAGKRLCPHRPSCSPDP